MSDKYAEIRAALDGATPGPWRVVEKAFDNDGFQESVIRGLNGRAAIAVALDFGANNPLMREANAALIAAANPATIRALLAERDALREALVIAEAMLCKQENELRSFGAHGPCAESAILTARAALAQEQS